MTTNTTTGLPPEILDQMPPNDPDAEMGVIGSIMLDPRLCDDVIIELRADEFYADANRILFGHLVDMHNAGNKIDVTLFRRRLKDSADWETIGGSEYITQVMNSVAVAAHAVHYAKIVREKATLRSLREVGLDIIRDAADATTDATELLTRCEQRIFVVADHRGSRRVRKIQDVLLDAMDAIDSRMEGEAPGVQTGFNDLDRLTGGLHDSELTILAGRPGIGKTAMALNIVDYVVCDCGLATLLVSLEMAELELVQRMLCGRARIQAHKFRSGYLGTEDREHLAETSAKLGLAPLWIDDSPSASLSEISAVARRLKRKHALELIVIDYLQLITPEDKRAPREEQIASMSRRLKGLARELQLPIICLAQLNRETEKAEGNRPKLSHLRGSGAIEQDADVVMFVHREEYYRHGDAVKEVQGQAELLVRKQRNGPTGDVKLTWQAEFTRFENRAQQEPF